MASWPAMDDEIVFVFKVWIHKDGVARIQDAHQLAAVNCKQPDGNFSKDLEFLWERRNIVTSEEQQGNRSFMYTFLPAVTFTDGQRELVRKHIWDENDVPTVPEGALAEYVALAKRVIMCSSPLPEIPSRTEGRRRPRSE